MHLCSYLAWFGWSHIPTGAECGISGDKLMKMALQVHALVPSYLGAGAHVDGWVGG